MITPILYNAVLMKDTQGSEIEFCFILSSSSRTKEPEYVAASALQAIISRQQQPIKNRSKWKQETTQGDLQIYAVRNCVIMNPKQWPELKLKVFSLEY